MAQRAPPLILLYGARLLPLLCILSHSLLASNPHLLHLAQHPSLCLSHVSEPSQTSLPQLKSEVFNSTHLHYLNAGPLNLPPHSCHVPQHPVVIAK
ncbi:hypothetical protein E2C01_030154 [Portunus trituberculatus]|uniref:Uncharacterized protein n=1 Tax=Portunus trituberculatus TaxID=210409 RepID=A0A5B7EU57_PORTR|nr:hypothetical protein [Portunus trituberculatus]